MIRETKYGGSFLERLLAPFMKRIPFTTWHVLEKEISPEHIIIDLGCGPCSRIRLFRAAYTCGIELFGPYIRDAKRNQTHNDLILADISTVAFKPSSCDVVIALDVLEHLPKEAALRVIHEAKRWTKKKIIITVPNGFHPGRILDENPLQEHKSAFSIRELKTLGFRVHGIGINIKFYRPRNQTLMYIVAILAYPLTLFSWYFPLIAYDLLAIYDKSENERINKLSSTVKEM
jgi:SAM-dependent methyltransferase